MDSLTFLLGSAISFLFFMAHFFMAHNKNTRALQHGC